MQAIFSLSFFNFSSYNKENNFTPYKNEPQRGRQQLLFILIYVRRDVYCTSASLYRQQMKILHFLFSFVIDVAAVELVLKNAHAATMSIAVAVLNAQWWGWMEWRG